AMMAITTSSSISVKPGRCVPLCGIERPPESDEMSARRRVARASTARQGKMRRLCGPAGRHYNGRMTTTEDHDRRLDEVIAAWLAARRAGNAPAPEAWIAAHPDLAGDLRDFLADRDFLDGVLAPVTPTHDPTLEAGTDDHLPRPGQRFGSHEVLAEISR